MGIDVAGLGPVEKTALLTLYARALDSRCQRPILGDVRADELVAELDYDFGVLRVRPSVGAPVVMRAKVLDERVRMFTAEHADAVVVDLGAGLSDAAGRTSPPPTVNWYNVDLPAIIALRGEFLPPGPHGHDVSARIGTLNWAAGIPAHRPTMLVADGLIGFLREAEMIGLFQSVTDHFRTGELAFNDYGRIGRMSRLAMRLIPQGTSKVFSNAGFADARQPENWNPKLTLVEETSLADAPEVALLPTHLRLGLRIPAMARKWRILRYRF